MRFTSYFKEKHIWLLYVRRVSQQTFARPCRFLGQSKKKARFLQISKPISLQPLGMVQAVAPKCMCKKSLHSYLSISFGQSKMLYLDKQREHLFASVSYNRHLLKIYIFSWRIQTFLRNRFPTNSFRLFGKFIL